MSAWAYECRARDDAAVRWFVSRTTIDELPPGTDGVLVRVGDDWVPAVVDRSRQVAVERMLLRDVVADDHVTEAVAAALPESGGASGPAVGQAVTAAAISLAGTKFVVVLVGLTTASGPGEADLAIADMQARFGVPVVLMGQEEDGTPVYYGDGELKDLLATVPVERMPWKEYR